MSKGARSLKKKLEVLLVRKQKV